VRSAAQNHGLGAGVFTSARAYGYEGEYVSFRVDFTMLR